MTGAQSATATAERHKGVAFAVIGFMTWGFSAWFYKQITYVDPIEIIAHRVIWAVPIAAVILTLIGRTHDLKRAFTTSRILVVLCITSLLVSANWFVFVIAVKEGWVLEASLGYFINPMMSVLIGLVLLGERMNPLQWIAIGLAAAGVAVQAIAIGSLPWVGLFLAATFAAYGYFRKTVDIGPAQGFLVETLLLLPLAIVVAVYFAVQGTSHFSPIGDPGTSVWLMLCGPMTAGPLIFFASAARRLRLATLGLMQYIAPSMIFVTAVFVFGEPIELGRLASFALIWSGLAVFSFAALRAERQRLRPA